jgi:hypothetical protein
MGGRVAGVVLLVGQHNVLHPVTASSRQVDFKAFSKLQDIASACSTLSSS